MRMLTSRDRRALRLGTIVIGAALVVSLGVLPGVRAFGAARDTLASEHRLLSRERDVVRSAPAAEASVRAAEHALATFADAAFDAAEPELATVEVARLIESIANLSGIAGVRSAPLGIELDEDEMTRLRVRVTGEADFGPLMLLLQRIEAGPALLRIEQLSVSADRRAGRAADADPLLVFAITVSGTGLPDRARLIESSTAPVAMRRPETMPSEAALLEALVDDPFRPGVNLPGATQRAEPLAAEPAPAVVIRVVISGTVVLPDNRGLVMATWGTEPPRLIRVGDSIGGLRLVRVEPGAAEFEDEKGSRTTVHVPKPGA
jgi:hypothetical protein